MSAQAYTWVCQHADAQGAERLVLLVLANYAGELVVGDDGATYFEAWPGIERIAEEARLDSLRTVQNALTRLAKTGQIERLVNAAPDHRIRSDRRPNLYRIHTRPRPLRQQLGRRFAPDEIAYHPSQPLAAPAIRRAKAAEASRLAPPDTAQTSVDNHPDGVSSRDTPRPHGVSSNDRPSTPRGVVSRRDGVSSDDATGCRLATPKPLEEPLEEQPLPNVSRAELPNGPAVENPAANGDHNEPHELADTHPLAQRAATVAQRVAPGRGGQAVGE